MKLQDHDIRERIETIGETARNYSVELYEEHLEEASFLYKHRQFLLNEPHGLWTDAAMIENRIQTHIDALIMDGHLAIELCCKKVKEDGDPGILYVAVRVFCHHLRNDDLKEILNMLDPGYHEQIMAVVDALNQDLPDQWMAIICDMLTSDDITLTGMAADIIAYRRIPMEDELMGVLSGDHDKILPNIVRAIGRLKMTHARSFLLDLVSSDRINNVTEEDTIRHEACLALLRIQDKHVIPILRKNSLTGNWHYLMMGLCGDITDVPFLQKITISPEVCDESILALGLLGDISSVDILMTCLNDPLYSRSAALSLNVLTGADLFEDVFIPEQIDGDNLFGDDLEKFMNGEPLYPPGKEPGFTVNCLSENSGTWKNWWRKNKHEFQDPVTYRQGKPFAPSGILRVLEAEKSPALLRQLAYEEFVARYDKDFCFDITLPVSEQRIVINTYKNWIETNEFKVRHGLKGI